MLNLAPEPLRVDTGFRQLTLLHLKVGGERLARCNTQLFRFRLEEEFIFGRNFLEDKPEDNTNVQKDTDAGEDEDKDADEEDDDFEDEALDDDLDDDESDDESDDDADSDDEAEDRLALPDWDDFPSVRSIWADGIDC
jgi:hypothetical protein